jgi:hypothetical protein
MGQDRKMKVVAQTKPERSASMTRQQVKEIILRDLPAILERDRQVREFILRLVREQAAGKQETESRFDRVLEEIRRDREEQTRKWEEQAQRWHENQQTLERDREEQTRKWEEQAQRWHENQQTLERDREEQRRRWEEQEQKWRENQQTLERDREEQTRKWEEQNQKWRENQQTLERDREEQQRRWEEQEQKWRENQQEIRQMLQYIQRVDHRIDTTIGALGARWGLYAEQSFRSALKGILEDLFNIRVVNVIEFDEQGQVFGRPEQVELDIVVKDDLLIICEIKSSISKPDMYVFERKARFYERRHDRKADRLLAISPMVDPQAQAMAKELGIQVCSRAEEVAPATFG